jgi:putative ABC transport system ATP-binding protein
MTEPAVLSPHPSIPLVNATIPVLSARGVDKTHVTGGRREAVLRGLDLDLHTGEVVAVVGPPGVGKTTLLGCLSGLDAVDAGSVVFDGQDIHRMTDAERADIRASRMGFVFQRSNLSPLFSAIDNVAAPLHVLGVAPAEARSRAVAQLARVGVVGRAGLRPTELASDERQLVAVARAMVTEPVIVWADEPGGNLDRRRADAVVDVLLDVRRKGQVVVIATPAADDHVAARARRRVELGNGKVVADVALSMVASTTANGPNAADSRPKDGRWGGLASVR